VFRIRRVMDDIRSRDRESVTQMQAILRSQFDLISEREIDDLAQRLRDPIKHQLRYILLVADNLQGKTKGFALMAHAPDLKFCYLDYIAAAKRLTGGGIGGALYNRVRQEARAMGVVGVFMECLPDDPALCSDPELLRQNKARLRFYENFGARPIANTAYETPFQPEDDCPPYLVFDGLDKRQIPGTPAGQTHCPGYFREKIRRCLPGGICGHGGIVVPGRSGSIAAAQVRR
jgi:GNAT superfamily N-acetyltransferase